MLFNHARASRLMKKYGVEILIASTPENVTYMTDFWSWSHWCLKGTQTYAVLSLDEKIKPYIVTPISEMDQAVMEETCWIKDFVTFGTFFLENPAGASLSQTEKNFTSIMASTPHKADALTALGESLQERGLTKGKIALDRMNIPPAIWQTIQKKLPDVEWVDGSPLLREIRAVKTPEEVKRLEESIAITEKSLLNAIKHIREGVTELAVARAYLDTIAQEGAVSILTCIGAGVRSGFPNVIPADYRIQKGDLIRFDIGCVYKNYYSDTARIAVLGRPTEKQRSYYAAVKLGEDRGLKLIRPEAKAADIFAESVRGVREAGIPHYRRGHVGHGIGIECYDIPSLSPVSGHLLEEGMVLNIETPYYELGFGGVQVEDTLVVTEDGYRLLTQCNRELLVL
jgi:Xaa-Pro dipeptidase